MTYDEPTFLPEGLAIWNTGEHRLVVDHPPFIKLWSSLPVLFTNYSLPLGHKSWVNAERWEFGRAFLFSNNADFIIKAGRLTILLLGMLLGIIVFLFSKNLFGKKAGLFALFIYSFSPNIIAHSSLITNDLASTFFIVLSLFLFLKEREKIFPWKTAISTGLAISSKFTGLYLLPFYFLIYAADYFRKQKSIAKIIKALITIFVFSFITLIIIYGFNLFALYDGINNVVFHSKQGHFNFLAGEHSTKGWWYYFPFAFLVKTPLPTIILFVVSIFFWFNNKNKDWKTAYLLIFVVYYFFMFSFNNINIGVRHVLPVFPIVFIILSQLINNKNLALKLFIIILLIWYVYGTISISPHYLSFFNEILGGPSQGYNYLIDSNIDWGQDLKILKQWQVNNNNKEIFLAYFGMDSPIYRNVSFNLLPCNKYVNGTIVVSVTHYQGLSKELAQCTAWLKNKEIKERIGYSLLVITT
ncbi:glycosyltransferase family 39 protein [Candidatus Woesearchaeota archaeon]|nr:glycosyltransferase family 39 protein [Candidatus Woesearchaeota archaeon]